MNTTPYDDIVIRILSPEVAADKLGWPLADVLKRRDELGLGPFVARRNARPKPKGEAKATATGRRVSGKRASGKTAKRKPTKRLAAVGA